MKRYPHSIFLLGLLLVFVGCAGTAVVPGPGAGVGTYSYMNRELTATYDEPLNTIWPKALDAVKKMHLTFRKKEIDALGGTIEARRSDTTLVKIRLTPLAGGDTSISVRVGMWGDREKSALVHKAIRREL